MTNRAAQSEPDRDEPWFLNHVRFTVISVTPQALPPAPEAWKAMYQTEPEEVRTLHRSEAIECRSLVDRWDRIVRSVPGRLDVVHAAHVPSNDYFGDFRKLKPYSDVLRAFATDWSRLLGSGRLHEATRLAVGGECLSAKGDKEEAYGTVMRLLPSMKLTPACSDFLYRINRPTTWARGAINRIGKWTVQASAALLVASPERQPVATRPRYAVAFEFDVNSDADRATPLDASDQTELLEQLLQNVTRLCSRGEQP